MIYIAAAVATSLLFAGVTVAGKVLAGTIPAFAFSFLRYGIAGVCLLPFIHAQKEKESVRVRDLPTLMFLGFTLVLLFNALFFNALYYSSATSVSLIGATNPLVTVLVSAVLLRHIPNRYQLTAFMLSFAGTVLVITEGKMGSSVLQGSIGELLMLLAVLCQIAYALVLKKASVQFSPLFLAFATLLSGILFVLPFVANQEFLDVVLHLTSFQWQLLIFIGCLGTALALYLYSVSIHAMGPSRTNLTIFSSMPIFVAILAYCILGEKLTLWQLLGGALVICGLGIGLRHTR
jgi:drug/metabolite transporter (DMT)-like permease